MSKRPSTASVANWQDFLEKVRTAEDELGRPEVMWYRGHSDASWSVLPGILRQPGWEDFEQQAFHAFQRSATRLFDRRLNDWEILFDMQHYGMPTRLVDWSEALGVAIAFVLFTPTPKACDAAVFVLDPLGLNEYSGQHEIKNLPSDDFSYKTIYWDHKPFAAKHPIAVYPPLQSQRLFAQRGTFTIHGDKTDGLENQCPDVVRKVVLPQAAMEAAREYLRQASLDEYAIYPDIVGMAKYLRRLIFEPGA